MKNKLSFVIFMLFVSVAVNFSFWTGEVSLKWLENNPVEVKNGSIIKEKWNIVYKDLEWNQFTNIWTITLSDWNEKITILDRDLWAKSPGTKWYYFKYGNNYWFAWEWMEVDVAPAGNRNNWEQWPCPFWYHLPTTEEFIKLVSIRCNIRWASCNIWTWRVFEDNYLYSKIIEDLNVFVAWWIASSNWYALYGLGDYVARYSSDRSTEKNKWNVLFFSEQYVTHYVSISDTNENSWYPIRCFQNNLTSIKSINSNTNNKTEKELAYDFAYNNKITTMPTMESANLNWNLNRISMAKILSQYAINVLWKQPNTSKNIKFNDVSTSLDNQYDNWVTLSYQLWIMWQNVKNGLFRPYDKVTRAEFATALSRLLYNTPDWTKNYYSSHLNILKEKWIISNTNPQIIESRWNVMIMLYRATK